MYGIVIVAALESTDPMESSNVAPVVRPGKKYYIFDKSLAIVAAPGAQQVEVWVVALWNGATEAIVQSNLAAVTSRQETPWRNAAPHGVCQRKCQQWRGGKGRYTLSTENGELTPQGCLHKYRT